MFLAASKGCIMLTVCKKKKKPFSIYFVSPTTFSCTKDILQHYHTMETGSVQQYSSWKWSFQGILSMLRCLLLMPFYLKVCVVSDVGGVSLSVGWDGTKMESFRLPWPGSWRRYSQGKKGRALVCKVASRLLMRGSAPFTVCSMLDRAF